MSHELWRTKLIPEARDCKARGEWVSLCKAVAKHLNSHDHGNTDNWNVRDCMAVNVVQQALSELTPFLYNSNPVASVASRSPDSAPAYAAQVYQEILNAALEEHSPIEARRAAISDALCYSRGVIRHGYDPVTELPTEQHVPIKDVFFDPCADYMEDLDWIAVRHEVPRHRLYALYPRASKLTTISGVAPGKKVTFYEVWTKIGSGRVLDYERQPKNLDNDPEKLHRYFVVSPHFDGYLLEPRPWEVDFWRDDAWPFEFLTLSPAAGSCWDESRHTIYPRSPIMLGLEHANATDMLATVVVNQLHDRAHTLIATDTHEPGHVRALANESDAGEGLSLFRVLYMGKNPGNRSLADRFQKIDFGQISAAHFEFMQWNMEEFKRKVGTPGASPDTQYRSAQAADIADRVPRNRLEGYIEEVEAWSARLARKALYQLQSRLRGGSIVALLTCDRVMAARMGPRLYRFAAVAGGGQRLGHRQLTDLTLGRGGDAGAALVLQTIAQQLPAMIRYYDNPEDPVLKEAVQTAVQASAQAGDPLFVTIEPLTFERLELDLSLSPREIVGGFATAVEAGSAQRYTLQRRLNTALVIREQVLGLAASAGDFETYQRGLEQLYRALHIPRGDWISLDLEFLAQKQQQTAEAAQREAQNELQTKLAVIQAEGQQKSIQIAQKAEAEAAKDAATIAFEKQVAPGGGGFA